MFIILLMISASIVQGTNVENATNITTEKPKEGDKKPFQDLLDTVAELQLLLNNTLQEINKREMEILKQREMYYQMRTAQVSLLKNKSRHPYPHKFIISITLEEAVDLCMSLDKGEYMNRTFVSLVGRIHHVRTNGTQIIFYDLKADNGIIQVPVEQNISEQEMFKGDIVGVKGHPGKSRSGELIVTSTFIVLLAPCLREITLPDELPPVTKFKKRHLDLILNDETKQIFRTKAKTIAYLRNFFDKKGFLEVETPILQPVAGGEVVKPFKTHHDSTKQDFFLRVAPEAYHKKLIIGGMDRIYEIGRQFRNKKIDFLHNPEQTTLEVHATYANYNDLMDMTENLLTGIIHKIIGSYEFIFHSNSKIGRKTIADFTPPFNKISVIPALEKLTGFKFPPADQLHTPESNKFLKRLCEVYYYEEECKGPKTSSYILNGLIEVLIRRSIKRPTFVVDYPQIISPFAKEQEDYPGLTERFELFAYERKIVNGYTEETDPGKLRKQFELQDLFKSQGDEHVSPTDESLISALEYGMPPTATLKLDVEHLTMYLADVYDMKGVILFPEVPQT